MPSNKTCSIVGCNEKYYSKDLCKKHYMKDYRKANRKRISHYNQEYWRMHPSLRHWAWAQNRTCYDKNSSYYQIVSFSITPEYTKEIWDRDNAVDLLRPSIDRIDDSKGYEYGNIQFVELSYNLHKKRGKRRERILLDNLEEQLETIDTILSSIEDKQEEIHQYVAVRARYK